MRESTLLKLRGALEDAVVIFARDGGVRLAPRGRVQLSERR
jgi:hypothetical protein